ncbi:alcohol dehydrogenase catalytic domain-containing protein [Olivibacter sp. SDN3]|uniref:alcohol dehydrogenase catalytic domain-containing protein n=1 Tax=Olivibacter sp. SDN3 TaxID=2764720 RepID=UPI0016512739|nr:alcohol dehydrogenase catalytic domain-containing protein [Olivibacter sp. SDN3]QNL49904.1 alcohol dehydrogenase catalytic domain-containing protein [Olivibacter sp. SDN3]
MKAIQIKGPGEVALIEIEKPEIISGHVMLKMEFVGFCGSDLNTFTGLNPLAKKPIVPGHEIGARIHEVGEEVPSFLKPGMSVTVNPYTSCGKCPACNNLRPNACEFNQTLGVQRDGAMAEYLLVPWTKVVTEAAIRVDELALVEPLSVGFHERLSETTGGKGADVVIEAVGRPETYVAAISEAAFTGRVVYIGYAKEKIPFDTQYFVKKEFNIMGSLELLPLKRDRFRQ